MIGSFIPNRPGHRSNSYRPHARSIRWAVTALAFLILLGGAAQQAWARDTQSDQNPSVNLKQLSLEQLGNVEVTTASKEPEEVWKTAAAIYVITQDDIRRSGATSLPELLRLVPGVEVARIDSDHWSVGIRGFGSEFSKSVLVLMAAAFTLRCSPACIGICRTSCSRMSNASK